MLRPRGPTLNFVIEPTQVKLAMDSAPLMSSLTFSKPAETYTVPQVSHEPVAMATAAQDPARTAQFTTPVSGVSTVVTESPVSVERVMTRKEALKVITSINQSKEIEPKIELKSPQLDKISTRKRPASPIEKAPQEKVITSTLFKSVFNSSFITSDHQGAALRD